MPAQQCSLTWRHRSPAPGTSSLLSSQTSTAGCILCCRRPGLVCPHYTRPPIHYAAARQPTCSKTRLTPSYIHFHCNNNQEERAVGLSLHVRCCVDLAENSGKKSISHAQVSNDGDNASCANDRAKPSTARCGLSSLCRATFQIKKVRD